MAATTKILINRPKSHYAAKTDQVHYPEIDKKLIKLCIRID